MGRLWAGEDSTSRCGGACRAHPFLPRIPDRRPRSLRRWPSRRPNPTPDHPNPRSLLPIAAPRSAVQADAARTASDARGPISLEGRSLKRPTWADPLTGPLGPLPWQAAENLHAAAAVTSRRGAACARGHACVAPAPCRRRSEPHPPPGTVGQHQAAAAEKQSGSRLLNVPQAIMLPESAGSEPQNLKTQPHSNRYRAPS